MLENSPYPPSSLRSLVCVLNRVIQKNKALFSVVDKNNYHSFFYSDKNTGLAQHPSELAEKSGVGVHYTNHSLNLRVTAITRMFKCGVPKKLVAENSGHRSRFMFKFTTAHMHIIGKIRHTLINPIRLHTIMEP